LKEDPRLHVSEADLEKQYQFVTQVNGRISLGHQTINDIRGLRKQLQDLRDRLPKTPENKPVLDAADALDKKMTEVEEGLIQTKAKSGEDALNFPIRVMNQMVDLANVAQESDAAPTAQSYQVYEVLNKELDVQLAKWKEVQSTELVALNQKMREANVPGVSIPPAKPNEPAPGRRRGN
jgi:hypothetical protein